jgi:hypothetical protein
VNRHRRQFLRSGSLLTAGWLLPGVPQAAGITRKPLRIALISDVHQDIMHDATQRITDFVKQARAWEADAVMELGDFCTPQPANRAFADAFEAFPGPKFHVIGNHETDGGFTREQVVVWHRMPARHYSFDLGGIHGIVLDGNDCPPGHIDGYPSHIDDAQIDWLRDDLSKTDLPVFVFSHQSLERPNCIRSQEKVRAVLEGSRHADGRRKVAACLNGHWHIDHAREIHGIPYIHINSASYYWLGSAFARERYSTDIHARHPRLGHTAPYRDPVFTLLEIDFAKQRFTLSARQSEWVGPSPHEIGAIRDGIDPAWVKPACSAREIRLA